MFAGHLKFQAETWFNIHKYLGSSEHENPLMLITEAGSDFSDFCQFRAQQAVLDDW